MAAHLERFKYTYWVRKPLCLSQEWLSDSHFYSYNNVWQCPCQHHRCFPPPHPRHHSYWETHELPGQPCLIPLGGKSSSSLVRMSLLLLVWQYSMLSASDLLLVAELYLFCIASHHTFSLLCHLTHITIMVCTLPGGKATSIFQGPADFYCERAR